MFPFSRQDSTSLINPTWSERAIHYRMTARAERGLLTLGFLLITYILFVLALNQPQGYVIDIYSALPFTLFLALIICYTCGVLLTIAGNGIYRSLGVLLLILNHAAILVIPYMLGYYSMGRADDMSYIGEYLQIAKSGQLAGWDIYPASHIIGATLSMITGLAPNLVSFIIPFIFSYLFIGGLVLCCRLFLKDQALVNIAIPSSFLLYLGPYNFLNVPHGLFFAMMPLFLYLIGRNIVHRRPMDIVLMLPFSLLIPFTHPYVVLFAVFTLGILVICSPVLKEIENREYTRAIRPLLLVAIGFLSWFIYSYRLKNDLGQSYGAYVGHTRDTVIVETAEKLFRIDMDIFKLVKLFTVYYGRYTIPLLVLLSVVILIFLSRRTVSMDLRRRFLFFGFYYGAFMVLEAIMFVNPLITHQPDRLTNLNVIVFAQVPLFVLSLFILFGNLKPFNRNTVFVLLIFSCTWSLTLFGAFDSPNIFRYNIALTDNEAEGMEWFFEERASNTVIYPISPLGRFHDILGVGDSKGDNNLHLSDHFGYGPPPLTFIESNRKYVTEGNLVMLTLDELVYQEVPGWIEVGRYVAADFVRFRNDDSLTGKTYDTTNLEIYHIS